VDHDGRVRQVRGEGLVRYDDGLNGMPLARGCMVEVMVVLWSML